MGILLEEVDGRHDHAGGAIAALEAVFFPEALLEGVQFRLICDALDREDFAAIGLDGEDRAGFRALAVDDDRASAALAGIASDVRASQAELFAEQVHEQQSRLDGRLARLSIDGEFYGDRVGHVTAPW